MHVSPTVARNHHELSCGYASSKEARQDTRIRGVFHGPRGGRVATLSPADEQQLWKRLQGAGKHRAPCDLHLISLRFLTANICIILLDTVTF